MNGFSLGLYHIRGIVRDRLIVDGRLGGRGEIESIEMLVVVLVQDDAHQIVNPLLHIVQEREEDSHELLADSREVSVGWLPRNGVKYVETCCKQRL